MVVHPQFRPCPAGATATVAIDLRLWQTSILSLQLKNNGIIKSIRIPIDTIIIARDSITTPARRNQAPWGVKCFERAYTKRAKRRAWMIRGTLQYKNSHVNTLDTCEARLIAPFEASSSRDPHGASRTKPGKAQNNKVSPVRQMQEKTRRVRGLHPGMFTGNAGRFARLCVPSLRVRVIFRPRGRLTYCRLKLPPAPCSFDARWKPGGQ